MFALPEQRSRSRAAAFGGSDPINGSATNWRSDPTSTLPDQSCLGFEGGQRSPGLHSVGQRCRGAERREGSGEM